VGYARPAVPLTDLFPQRFCSHAHEKCILCMTTSVRNRSTECIPVLLLPLNTNGPDLDHPLPATERPTAHDHLSANFPENGLEFNPKHVYKGLPVEFSRKVLEEYPHGP
jgi:hypothetical protein